ncbi:helix-turn-helix domain-containing protein [Moritella sp.]|uniref:GlxA family transcriptional regulator n=1 Tax=Moritella sp. TaxID=78556 RepID=UPI001D35F920|nr:helix-turn-helix domain-containing protein [Moritella sp.]MCJ8352057.1 helix-turn-helix domain-containing protein [Moritella sp.]NQZ42136.1 helix-turn-helix domain-containing protein [Moritella sp.]
MKIGFVLYDKALVTGISLAAEMLSGASRLRDRKTQHQDPLEIKLISTTLEAKSLTAGLRLQPDLTFSCEQDFDLVIFPPMWGNPLVSIIKHPEIIPWLHQQYNKGAKILSTGTGVCWLAEAGLLDGLPATTHWYFYDQFSQQYPQVKLNRQASITAANGLYCAGSINSQSEMMLFLINEMFGKKIASVIENHFSHEISRTQQQPFYQVGGQVQFDESIALAQDWMQRNMAKVITNQIVADVCQLPLRTFNRRFKEQVGQTPNQFLLTLRLETAQVLLRDFGLTMCDVAEQVGFRDTYYFNKKFQQHFDMAPKQYRDMVKAKVFAV